MLKRSSLVPLVLLAGLSTAGAQQTSRPDLDTHRSVATQPANDSQADLDRKDWVAHVMSGFLDDNAPHRQPDE